MSEKLEKIIELESDLINLFNEGLDINDERIQNVTFKIKELLPKLNNLEILYLLKEGDVIHEVIDVASYLKKYKINKKRLSEEKSYKEAFKKLNLFVEMIQDASISEQEYMYMCQRCDVDNIANFLLSNMTNEEIMSLSTESDDWNYKLFLYGNLKK